MTGYRTVNVHVTEAARKLALRDHQFCSNRTVTSRYQPWNFVPKNLFHQFKRSTNLYFLFVALLQLVPGLSPTSWLTNLVPLSCVLLLNGFKEGFDDWTRHKSDKQVNHRRVGILKGEEFVDHSWKSVIVGDILKVDLDSQFPADMVFLCSSDPQGMAYEESANLDGESNLKLRNSLYKLGPLVFEGGDNSLAIFSGLIIKCELPNSRFYQFDGAINLQGEARMPVSVSQVLYRGATLRNTTWVIGAVVFTGPDTKVFRNMIKAPKKVSSLGYHMKVMVQVIFVLLFVVCFSLAVGGNVWMIKHNNVYYLPNINQWPELGPGFRGICIRFFRFLILLHELIPISLYVTLELVKVVQCLYVNMDLLTYCAETDRPARASASSLMEELGQVEYVLADKTGTLTQNVMAFVRCSIGGVLYGKKDAEGPDNILTDLNSEESSGSVHLVSEDPKLLETLRTESEQGRRCCDFLTHLAINHTVFPRYIEEEGLKYQSASPDEAALVQGAAECGFQLESRTPEDIIIHVEGIGLEKRIIMAVLEFTSERKRMSVICKDDKGRIKVHCKGADSIILKRLKDSQTHMVQKTLQHLEEIARAGYRTLCIAEREITQREYDDWAALFRTASFSPDDRQAKLEVAAESIERDMLSGSEEVSGRSIGSLSLGAYEGDRLTLLNDRKEVLLGVTAVEDKLQEGVPETVTMLGQARIKLWILTGDKMETAVSIGLSCNLLTDSMHLFLLSEMEAKSVPQMLKFMLDEARSHFDNKLRSGYTHSDMAIVIEGNSMAVALEEINRPSFLQLCQYCRAVVCCRASPIQKAQVTQLVRDSGFVVLAIGDGANDVGMIKAAQVGVGISGREGSTAVVASDYSIAQFRFLARLLLVHGRWSYKRNMDLVMYAFYKNMVYVMGNIYFSIYSAYSAQPMYPGVLISSYDMFWTALPIMSFAVLERDVSHCTAENNPQLYVETQAHRTHQFFVNVTHWFLSALWHSAVAFYFPWCAILSSEPNGETGGIWNLGTTVYTMVVVIVSLKLATYMTSYTIFQDVILWFTVASLLIFLLLLSIIFSARQVSEDLDASGLDLYQTPVYWLLLVLCPITACLPDVALEVFRRRSTPRDSDIMREIEHGWRDGEYIKGSPDFVEPITVPSKDSLLLMEEGVMEDEKEEDSISQGDPKIGGMLPRRLTWREVVNDEQIDGIHHLNSLSRYGRRSSSGFRIVTRHSDSHRNPRPLHEGPTPPHRTSRERSSQTGPQELVAEPKNKKKMRRMSPLARLTQRWSTIVAVPPGAFTSHTIQPSLSAFNGQSNGGHQSKIPRPVKLKRHLGAASPSNGDSKTSGEKEILPGSMPGDAADSTGSASGYFATVLARHSSDAENLASLQKDPTKMILLTEPKSQPILLKSISKIPNYGDKKEQKIVGEYCNQRVRLHRDPDDEDDNPRGGLMVPPKPQFQRPSLSEEQVKLKRKSSYDDIIDGDASDFFEKHLVLHPQPSPPHLYSSGPDEFSHNMRKREDEIVPIPRNPYASLPDESRQNLRRMDDDEGPTENMRKRDGETADGTRMRPSLEGRSSKRQIKDETPSHVRFSQELQNSLPTWFSPVPEAERSERPSLNSLDFSQQPRSASPLVDDQHASSRHAMMSKFSTPRNQVTESAILPPIRGERKASNLNENMHKVQQLSRLLVAPRKPSDLRGKRVDENSPSPTMLEPSFNITPSPWSSGEEPVIIKSIGSSSDVQGTTRTTRRLTNEDKEIARKQDYLQRESYFETLEDVKQMLYMANASAEDKKTNERRVKGITGSEAIESAREDEKRRGREDRENKWSEWGPISRLDDNMTPGSEAASNSTRQSDQLISSRENEILKENAWQEESPGRNWTAQSDETN